MLTFIQLDDNHILYGDVIFRRHSTEVSIVIIGLNASSGRAYELPDPDGTIWQGMVNASITLPSS